MTLLIGLILLALGLSLAVVWWSQLLVVLQGLAVLLLLGSGAICLIIGYSRKKAEHEYSQAVRQPEDAPATQKIET